MGTGVAIVKAQLPKTYDEYNSMSKEDKRELSGQGNTLGNFLPRLKINYDAEVEVEGSDPIQTPRGVFKITITPEGGDTTPVTAYAKTAILRIFSRGFRYVVYNSTTQKLDLISSIFKAWGDVVIDTLGNEATGWKFKKSVIEEHPEFESSPTQLKCQQVVYGLVSLIDAVDMHKNPVEVVDVPAIWIAKGTGYMPVNDILEKFTIDEVEMSHIPLTLTTKREKNEGVTYWTPQIKAGKEVAFTEDNYTLMQQFNDTIDAENMDILEKYKKSLINNLSETNADKVVSSADLKIDFDDEIPL